MSSNDGMGIALCAVRIHAHPSDAAARLVEPAVAVKLLGCAVTLARVTDVVEHNGSGQQYDRTRCRRPYRTHWHGGDHRNHAEQEQDSAVDRPAAHLALAVATHVSPIHIATFGTSTRPTM